SGKPNISGTGGGAGHQDSDDTVSYLVTAGSYRCTGHRIGSTGRGITQNGNLWVRAYCYANSACYMAQLGLGNTPSWASLRALRRASRIGTNRSETHDRLHLGQPYGLHYYGPRCGGSCYPNYRRCHVDSGYRG